MNKYYTVLGLPTTASKEEIRRKYRQLVLIWHPDRNSSPEAHGKFIAITEAYDILMGERPIPRTKATYSRPKQPTNKTSRPTRISKTELLRRKFEKVRSDYQSAPNANQLRINMYNTAKMYFVFAGIVIACSLVGPFLLGSVYHIVWAMPLGIGGGGMLLWNGGRFKVRADMIFGNATHYTDEEIAEFFVERPGSSVHDAAGDY